MAVSISLRYRALLKLAVSILLLAFILKFIGLGKAYAEISSAKISYILLAAAFTVPAVYFMALRWKNAIAIFNMRLDTKSSVNYTLIGQAFGMITPGRIGELIKAKYLSDDGNIGYFRPIMTALADKIFDAIAIVFLALLGGMIIFKGDTGMLFFWAFLFYTAALTGSFFYLKDCLAVAARIAPKKFRKSTKQLRLGRKAYVKMAALSLLIWVLHIAQAFLVMKALGAGNAGIAMIAGAVPLMALASMAPVTLGGIGARELAAIYIFGIAGVGPEKSAVFSLIYSFIGLGLPAIAGAVIYFRERDIFK